MSPALRVLHVCTGNICRSPMAEALTRSGLAARLGPAAGAVQVGSAGTWAHAGSPMEPDALAALAELDVDGAGFRARPLTAELVAEAELVVTATREHRAAAVALHPRAAARTFTLRELARLAALVDPAELPAGDVGGRGRALVRAVAARRGSVPPGEDDLRDPYRAPFSAFARCAEQVRAALEGPLELLAGPVRDPAGPVVPG